LGGSNKAQGVDTKITRATHLAKGDSGKLLNEQKKVGLHKNKGESPREEKPGERGVNLIGQGGEKNIGV